MPKTTSEPGVTTIIPAPRRASHLETGLKNRPAVAEAKSHHLLDINLHVFGSASEAAEVILDRAAGGLGGTSVFTCNVDHVMLMNSDARFREAYERADVVTIDGAPLALLSKWTGTDSASRVTGVDLTVAMTERAAATGLKVALVGGAEGRAARAASNLKALFPALPEVFVDSPQMGFELGDAEDTRLIRALNDYGPDVVIVCLGAPKQELWIDRHRDDLPGAALLGAGATIDFLSGHQSRAPRIFQRTGTEAFYRLATDFRRLWRRYLVRDVKFLAIFFVVWTQYIFATIGLVSSTRSHTVLPASARASGPHSGHRGRCGACVTM